jgi:predicted kinase
LQRFAILAGLPGSGKSTLSRKLNAEEGFFVVSSDAIRLALNAGVYPRDPVGSYAVLDPIVWDLASSAITALLRTGANVAVDATNLTRHRRAVWAEVARAAVPGIPIHLYWCTGTYDSAGRWEQERGVSRGEYLMIRRRLESSVEPPGPDEADVVHYVSTPTSVPAPAREES